MGEAIGKQGRKTIENTASRMVMRQLITLGFGRLGRSRQPVSDPDGM